MEVPVINRISNFESGVACLQNPTFLSQILSISGTERVFQAYSFWKWGALIIAMIASIGTIISRIKILVIKLKCRLDSSSSEPLLGDFEDEDYSDDDDDVSSCSSSSTVSDFEEVEPSATSDDTDFHVKGSGHYLDDQGQNHSLRHRRPRSLGGHRFSWSDFSSGKSVVKLWDSLGLGLDFDDSDERVVSVYDLNKEQKTSSIFAGKWLASTTTSVSAPASILSAGTSGSGMVSLGVWDTRVGCRIPAMLAEWGPHLGKFVGVASNGAEKFYVRDDVNGDVTVGDLRKVSSPLKKMKEADVDYLWWDANSVIGSDESVSAVTRCCDAVRSYLL
ncbi:hypothetical protein UlMin_040558 [Ulmus minor]